jgi:hypothetical protein
MATLGQKGPEVARSHFLLGLGNSRLYWFLLNLLCLARIAAQAATCAPRTYSATASKGTTRARRSTCC